MCVVCVRGPGVGAAPAGARDPLREPTSGEGGGRGRGSGGWAGGARRRALCEVSGLKEVQTPSPDALWFALPVVRPPHARRRRGPSRPVSPVPARWGAPGQAPFGPRRAGVEGQGRRRGH